MTFTYFLMYNFCYWLKQGEQFYLSDELFFRKEKPDVEMMIEEVEIETEMEAEIETETDGQETKTVVVGTETAKAKIETGSDFLS